MRLKKLEIYGFKSFADRVEMRFDYGVTGIVGQNLEHIHHTMLQFHSQIPPQQIKTYFHTKTCIQMFIA